MNWRITDGQWIPVADAQMPEWDDARQGFKGYVTIHGWENVGALYERVDGVDGVEGVEALHLPQWIVECSPASDCHHVLIDCMKDMIDLHAKLSLIQLNYVFESPWSIAETLAEVLDMVPTARERLRKRQRAAAEHMRKNRERRGL